MPTGTLKKARNPAMASRSAKVVAPSTVVFFFTSFTIRKNGANWHACTPDSSVVGIDADRDGLVKRVQVTAINLSQQGGNVEVTVCNEQGLTETRYNYWSPETLENHNKPVESVGEQIRSY